MVHGAAKKKKKFWHQVSHDLVPQFIQEKQVLSSLVLGNPSQWRDSRAELMFGFVLVELFTFSVDLVISFPLPYLFISPSNHTAWKLHSSKGERNYLGKSSKWAHDRNSLVMEKCKLKTWCDTRMTKIHKTDHTKCWRGFEVTRMLIHHWWKCEMIQPL